LGHVDEAVQNYRFYLKAYPDDATARFDLGVILLQTARHEEAIKEFKEVLRLDPMFTRAWINLATSYSDLDRPSEALANYAKAFELEPTWVTLGNLNHEYGFTLVRNGDVPKAREVFGLALAKRNMEEYALRSLALVDMYEGKYREAQARLREAIRISEGDPEPLSRSRHHIFLAILMEGQDDRAGQLRELDRALEALEKGSSPPAWLAARIGAGYARAGDVGKAARILRKISSQTDRDNPSGAADFNILEGEIALASRNYTRGIEKLQLGAQAIPLPLGLASLAHAYQRAGSTDEAIACDEKLVGLGRRALGWEPQQSWLEAHAELAEMYLSRGERTKAAQMVGELARLWKDADPNLPLVKKINRLQKQIQGH
ncbi:MAG: tetratricopeptide repeat protein, partial [Nitrospirales bacterium]